MQIMTSSDRAVNPAAIEQANSSARSAAHKERP
jgi:hypothetical protein